MSEAPVIETPEVPVEAPTEVVVSPTEEQAREQGWVSKEEWVESGRAEDEWRPAKEFIDRGELYKSIHSTKRELKQTQAVLQALQRHHNMVFEKAHQQAIKDLRMEKRVAIRSEDFERLEEVETKIEELQDQHQQERAQVIQSQTAAAQVTVPEFDAFLERNNWYREDKSLRDEADAVGFIYLNNGGNKDLLFQHVEKEMRRKFPDKFGVKRAAPNAVAATVRGGKAPSQDSFELDDNEKEVMRTFVRQGIMTEAQYKAELKKVKGKS